LIVTVSLLRNIKKADVRQPRNHVFISFYWGQPCIPIYWVAGPW